MATFRFEVNSRPSKNKKYCILLCVTIQGKRKRIKTPIEVKKKSDFNTKCKGDKWIRTCVPECKKWNQILSDILEDTRKHYTDLKQESKATTSQVIDSLKQEETSDSFILFATNRTEEILQAGGIRNWKRYKGFLNKLQDYLSKKHKKDLLFSELSVEFLSSFDNYLHKLKNERDSSKLLHPNTIQVQFNIFRALVTKGVELGYLSYDKDPFLIFKYSGVKTEKEKLTDTEIRAIEELSLPEGTELSISRDCFLFSFYCAGIRAGDLVQLRWGNITPEGRLNYQMGKNHKVKDLILVQQAQDILKKYHKEGVKATDYIFPLMRNNCIYTRAVTQAEKDTLPIELQMQLLNSINSKNSLINKNLKKIAKLAGIEKAVSMHISRHSFAKIAKSEGTDNAIMKNLLAHSSLSITEGYMGNFDTEETDKALKHIFEKRISTAEPQPVLDPEKAELFKLINNLTTDQVKDLLQNLQK